jgi:sugar fermentation stimulation protein A
MKFPAPLEKAILRKRYKRFLADVEREDGSTLTIHCPNTGSMKNCWEPGDEVWMSRSSNPKRKYAYTWELVRTKRGHYIGINTSRANEIVRSAIESGAVDGLSGYTTVKAEVPYGENSRIDLLLSSPARPECYVEVKSVTLLESPVRAGIGYFPDAVSTRGTKHLRELMQVSASGQRAVLCFCVQHSGIREVRPAAKIDPVYAETLAEAMNAGVEAIALKTRITRHRISVSKEIPVRVTS